MVKINLEDLSPQTAFPSSIGKEKELSLIVYNTLKMDFEKKDVSNFIIELLMSINEQSLNTIKSIFKYEADLLRDMETSLEELVCLNKLNSFFKDSSLESITVFSSLVQGIPETKSNVHFREEIFKLAEILEEMVKNHIDFYKDLGQEDRNFERINQNIYFLQNLLNMVKNYALKNIKRLGSELHSKMNIEDQIKVLSRLLNINNGNSNLLLEQKSIKALSHKEDVIEDAVLIDEDENKEQKFPEKINNTEAMEEIKKLFLNQFELIKTDINESKMSIEEQLQNVTKENTFLKDELTKLSLINVNLVEKFSKFIDSQLVLQKAIKDKYNINF